MEQFTPSKNRLNDGFLRSCDCVCANTAEKIDKSNLNLLEISQAIQDLDSRITELEQALNIGQRKNRG